MVSPEYRVWELCGDSDWKHVEFIVKVALF